MDGEAVAVGAFLRPASSAAGSPEAWPQPWAGGEPLMAVHIGVGSIPAMAARWLDGWAWLQARRARHTSGDTAPHEPSACFERLFRRSLLGAWGPGRHSPGLCRPVRPQPQQANDPASWQALKPPLAMARAKELGQPGGPQAVADAARPLLVPQRTRAEPAPASKKFIEAGLVRVNGIEDGPKTPLAPRRSGAALWMPPPKPTPTTCCRRRCRWMCSNESTPT